MIKNNKSPIPGAVVVHLQHTPAIYREEEECQRGQKTFDEMKEPRAPAGLRLTCRTQSSGGSDPV